MARHASIREGSGRPNGVARLPDPEMGALRASVGQALPSVFAVPLYGGTPCPSRLDPSGSRDISAHSLC